MTNIFRQAGEDCVLWLMHYCEVEARLHHSEGHGSCYSMSHPLRRAQVTHMLRLASEQLEKARKEWLEREKKQTLQLEAIRRMREKKQGTIKYVRAELERLSHRAAVAVEAIHGGSEDLADPEIYIDNVKKADDGTA